MRQPFLTDPHAHLFARRTASAPLTVNRRDPDFPVGVGLAVVAIALAVLLALGLV